MEGKTAGIAQVWSHDGARHCGMGIVLDARRILTCAHVIVQAAPKGSTSPPAEPVILSFPFYAQPDRKFSGKLKAGAWAAPDEEDCAIIELDEAVPAEVGVAMLAKVRESMQDDPVELYGIGQTQRGRVKASYRGHVNQRAFQINGDVGLFAEKGFSGAGVWSPKFDAYIGMLTSGYTDGSRVSFIRPIAVIEKKLPEVRAENRRLTKRSLDAWRFFSRIFLFGILYFFAAQKWFWEILPPKHPQVAAFAGMHFYAVGAVIIAVLLLLHAGDFSLHGRWQRLPRFPGTEMFSAKTAAILTLTLMMALPLYGQLRFLKVFFFEGRVFVYANDFGILPEERTYCLEGDGLASNPLCAHDNAKRFRLFVPENGAEGGYWNNHYHYGDKSSRGDKAAMYYPILTPVVVLLFSAIALLLNLRTLWLLRR